MRSYTNEFAKMMAFRNVLHTLGAPQSYGYRTWAMMFDDVTSDKPWQELPTSLTESIGSVADLRNLAEGLNEAYSVVMDTLRQVVNHEDAQHILEGVE